MSFGSNLRFLRKQFNETQYDVAKVVGKGRSLVSMWEIDKKDPLVKDVITLAEHYNVDIVDLYQGDLRLQQNVKLDDTHVLDSVIMNKTKVLSEEDKKKIIDLIDVYTK